MENSLFSYLSSRISKPIKLKTLSTFLTKAFKGIQCSPKYWHQFFIVSFLFDLFRMLCCTKRKREWDWGRSGGSQSFVEHSGHLCFIVLRLSPTSKTNYGIHESTYVCTYVCAVECVEAGLRSALG